jgi:hypothetical protein
MRSNTGEDGAESYLWSHAKHGGSNPLNAGRAKMDRARGAILPLERFCFPIFAFHAAVESFVAIDHDVR